MKVLVVEDDADARDLVRWTLERAGGFAVEECATAAAALEVARRARPDVVVLDVMMPDLDGVSLARLLRSQPDTAGAGIVFMTACLRPDDIARYAEVGALDVIAKPFDPARLPGRLRVAHAMAAPAAGREPAGSLRALERGYRVELPDRIRDIERALSGVSAKSVAVVQQAAVLAHRLAGSAAVFGMSDVSETARALEDALGRFLLEDAEASRRSIEGLVGELRRRADAQAVAR